MNALASAAPLSPVPGFEGTAYALMHGRLVWAGREAVTDHPRNAHRPWQPARQRFSPVRLRAGAACLLAGLEEGSAGLSPRGLLWWLCGQPLPFPMQPAQARFDALRAALHAQDLPAFEAAALRVLGVERMDPGGGARVVIHKDGPARVRVGDALPARGQGRHSLQRHQEGFFMRDLNLKHLKHSKKMADEASMCR